MSVNISISYILYKNDIIVNLYKLHFPSSPFSLQPNKKVFHPPTFPPLQSNTHEGKPNLFYPPTNFPSSYFSTPPTKQTLRVMVNNSFKENFYEKKIINILIAFSISHKSSVKISLK